MLDDQAIATAAPAEERPGSGSADPWYNGCGLDASEVSAMAGAGTASSGTVKTGSWRMFGGRREGGRS